MTAVGYSAAALSDAIGGGLLDDASVNVLRLSLHPGGLAPRIINLGQWRAHLLERLHRRRCRPATRNSGTATDVTVDELQIESFFPANEATAQFLRTAAQ